MMLSKLKTVTAQSNHPVNETEMQTIKRRMTVKDPFVSNA